MQTVSDAWKTEQRKIFVGESFVEIALNIGDPDAQADATASDNGHEVMSDTANLTTEIEKNPVKYATLEQNIWVLDGSFRVLPDSEPYGENGYVGNKLSSNSAGYTESYPTVTISFTKTFTNIVPGITIVWGEAYNEWAVEFDVNVYNGTSLVVSESVTDNSSITSVVSFDYSNYDKIEIVVKKWSLPYRRVRIKSVLLGISRTYDKSEIISYSHEMMVDALSATLPKAEISFTVSNIDGEYNPDNPEGFTKYLMVRQSITARYGYLLNGSIEWIKGGTFYMSEWETPQNGITASFKARDAIEYMQEVYSGTASGTLYDIADAAFRQSGMPELSDGSDRWVIDDSLKSITAATGADLSNRSCAEVVQLCANAGCCVFWQDRSGILHVEPLPGEETDYRIDRDNSYADSEMKLTKQLRAIDVNNGQYFLTVGAVGETQPLNNPLISDSRAETVATWAANYLMNRKTLSGQFRADPRLDALDRVTNENSFSESVVLVTDVKYTYNGAFRGSYTGRKGV